MSTRPSPYRRRRAIRPLVLLALGLVAVAVLYVVDVPTVDAIRGWAEATGAWFPVVFFLAYVGFTQLPVPRTVHRRSCRWSSSGTSRGIGRALC